MPHLWQHFTLGRICRECGLTQVRDEFEHGLPCSHDKDDRSRFGPPGPAEDQPRGQPPPERDPRTSRET